MCYTPNITKINYDEFPLNLAPETDIKLLYVLKESPDSSQNKDVYIVIYQRGFPASGKEYKLHTRVLQQHIPIV